MTLSSRFILRSGLLLLHAVVSTALSAAPIELSEFLARNDQLLLDGDGNDPDWVELHNPNDTAVDLTGYYLTDHSTEPTRWVFPASSSIPAGGYRVVFCSGAVGPDFTDEAGNLHTNFKLDSAVGNSLVLFDPDGSTVIDSFDSYLEQQLNVSFGKGSNARDGYFTTPSPGAANGVSFAGFVAEPTFSLERGVYGSSQSLQLTPADPAEEIHYTTDGSEPVPGTHGTLFSGSIPLTSSRVIRAVASRPGSVNSSVATHSYIINPNAAAQSLPIISLAGDPSTTFGSQGLFAENLLRGRIAEFPLSVEMMNSDTWNPMQMDAGVRLHGSSYTRRTAGSGHKWSFKTYFRDDYEPNKQWLKTDIIPKSPLTRWRSIVLRGAAWDTNPMIRDEFSRRLYRDMGNQSALGGFAYLMINGSPYKNALYNPVERIDENTLQEKWGSNKQWDVITKWQNNGSATDPPRSHNEPFKFDARDGDHVAFAEILHYAQDNDLADPAHYASIEERIDLENYADYLLLMGYLAVRDWPQNNWAAARERSDSLLGKWQFFVWDAESWTTSQLSGPFKVPNSPFGDVGEQPVTILYESLRDNSNFRRLMSDRAFFHLFHEGALTSSNAIARFEEMRITLATVLPGMKTWIRDSWAPRRPGYALSSLTALDLFTFEGPAFMVDGQAQQTGGLVDLGSSLNMVNPTSGTIYYTLDGSDPQLIDQPGTGVSPSALTYSSALSIDQTTHVKARIYKGSTWSALGEAVFIPGIPATAENLVISELMYNPDGISENLEYLELMNTSTIETLDLGGLSFTDGIQVTLPNGTALAPGERILIVANIAAFSSVYSNALPVATEFSGSLRNSGEMITLLDASGLTIESFSYSDDAPWPEASDGDGFSLTRISPQSHLNPDNSNHWRSSVALGGSPGVSDASSFTGTGPQELLAYALGTAKSSFRVSKQVDKVILTYPRNLSADDVAIAVESSGDMLSWTPLDPGVYLVSESAPVNGISEVTVIFKGPATPSLSRHFSRLHVELRP